jgi:hypothetical protein
MQKMDGGPQQKSTDHSQYSLERERERERETGQPKCKTELQQIE